MMTTDPSLGYVPGFHGAGPLTTVFTTPDFCKSLYWTDTITPPLSSVVCMPPKFHSLFDYSFGFYSPGICPSAWTKGCDFPTSLARTANGGSVYYGGTLLKSETAQICCPDGYSCLSSGPYSYSKCVATTDSSELAFALQVRWQASDLPNLATDPTVPGSTYSAPSTATATPSTVRSTSAPGSGGTTPTPSLSPGNTVAQNADPSANNSSRMRSGAIIGIAVGVGGMAIALTVCTVVFIMWWRRRKRREHKGPRAESVTSKDGDSKSPPPPPPPPPPAAKGDGYYPPDNKFELDSSLRASTAAFSEAPGETGAVEMPPQHVAAAEMEVPHFVAELPGSMPEAGSYEVSPLTDAPRSPLPTAETSRRESGVLGLMGHRRRRSVGARGQSVMGPASSPTISVSSTDKTTATLEDR